MDALSRVSLGVKLPTDYHAQITTLQNDVRRKGGDASFRASGVSELAVFACVPGEMGVGNITRLGVVLKELVAQMQPFEVRFVGLVGEPNAVQPRAASILLEGAEPFEYLSRKVEMAGIHMGTAFGSFTPHIEIGRLKQLTDAGRVNLGRAIKMTPKPEFAPLRIEHIDLLIAQTGPTGPDLRTLERFPFAASGVMPPPVLS